MEALANYVRFCHSAAPVRFLHRSNGGEGWQELCAEAVEVVREGFAQRLTAFEVPLPLDHGRVLLLLDILRMQAINVGDGSVRSIAWIDANGVRFFPDRQKENDPEHVENENDDAEDEEQHEQEDAEEEEENDEDDVSSAVSGVSEEEEEEVQSNAEKDSENSCFFVSLDDNSKEYRSLMIYFLKGMASLPCNFVGVRKMRQPSMRVYAFAKLQAKALQDKSVRYAWKPSSSSSTSLDQFCNVPLKLFPDGRQYLCAAECKIDENGEQHMLLCRLIMGNTKEVNLGTHNYCESDDTEVHTVVDDLNNPSYYIVSSKYAHVHVFPEFLVTFKVSPVLAEQWKAAKADNSGGNLGPPASNDPSVAMPVQTSFVRRPSSAYMSFPKLLSILAKFLPRPKLQILKEQYSTYKERKLGRDEFIRRVRLVVGDRVLIAMIKYFEGKRLRR